MTQNKKGPLTFNNNGQETVVGIVSFSKKGLDANGTWTSLVNGKLAVYARVTEQLDWIAEEMKKKYDNC